MRPDHPTRPPRVAIIGAGAAGTLSTLHLVREAGRRRTPVEVVLVDPADRWGRGTAFGTPDERHLLNVPAAGMSALPEDPGHFVAWLRAVDGTAGPATFAPRRTWARYLDEALTRTLGHDPSESVVRHVRRRAVTLDRSDEGATIGLDDGTTLDAAAVVIAPGLPAAGSHWAPAELLRSPFFVPDPWAPGALDVVRRDAAGPADVLLVGAGLTMADVVLGLAGSREGRVLHAVSRSGRLPARHAAHLRPAVIPDIHDWEGGLDELRRHVADHLTAVRASAGDWRPALDGLRFRVAELWQRLDSEGREQFLRQDMGRWNTLRHRLPPTTADRLDDLRTTGALTLDAATIGSVTPRGDGGLTVRLTDGTVRDVGWVVNCTGPRLDVRTLGEPLLDDLLRLRTGDGGALAIAAIGGMGVLTNNGRLLDGSGAADGVLWTLGALRRGELWESTAIPEIRTQALELAQGVLHAVAPLPRRLADGTWVHGHHPLARPRDPLGLPISTTSDAAAAYNAGIERVLRLQTGAEERLLEAVGSDPSFAVGHAALALLRHQAGVVTGVAHSLSLARAAAAERADDRERSFVEVVTTIVRGDRASAAAALRRHLADHPRDALALSVAVPTIAFAGSIEVRKDAWQLVDDLGPDYGDHWWYISLLAFVRQEQGRYDEAALLAESALSCEPASGHAAHALAHVHYETGEHETGRTWLDHWLEAGGRESSHRAHFVWHAGLHDLSLDDTESVAARLAGPLQAPTCCGVRGLVDATSLIWRWRVTGPAWDAGLPAPPSADGVLATVDRQLLLRPPTAFHALHAAVAHASSGSVEALDALADHCQRSPDEATRTVVTSVCLGLADLVQERWSTAAWRLAAALPGLGDIGGSAAQHEVIEETLLLALHRAGEETRVRELLTTRLERRGSPIDRRRLAAVGATATASRPA
jgi:uncharacterized NAD(P)/FAD-binding protein YdhS/tetratricopeptide (TPR) repeat protein